MVQYASVTSLIIIPIQDENAVLIDDLRQQLADLLQANKELRSENEKLRQIY